MSQIIKDLSSGPVPPQVATSYVTDSGIAIPAFNVLNVLGGVGADTSGSGNTITINVTTSGFDWVEKSTPDSPYTIISGQGVFCNGAMTVLLPPNTLLAIGATVIVYIDTASPVIIQADGVDRIQVGENISAVGGTATSTVQGNILELVYKPSDDTWHTISSMGSWLVV